MKIDIDCINHNLVQISDECSEWIEGEQVTEEIKNNAVESLAHIAGAIDLAKRLEEVLKG